MKENPNAGASSPLEEQIDRWRTSCLDSRGMSPEQVEDLEARLRKELATLANRGLSSEEALLVALNRLHELPAFLAITGSAYTGEPWKQFKAGSGIGPGADQRDMAVAFGLAVLAALLIKLPAFFGLPLDGNEGFYARNLGFFALPLLAGYFTWKRKLAPATIRWVAVAFLAALIFANAYPYVPGGDTEGLAALHLPIALWVLIGVAYGGQRWRTVAGRMDFIRFTGELFIYYVLIALGGGVLIAFMAMIFELIGLDLESFFESWLLPCGAMGGFVVAAWLAEAKKSVIENMAPILTRLFTPLFTLVLLTFLGALLWTGRSINMDREVLIAFDLLLVLVLGLMLYTISARDADAPPGAFDVLQLVLLISALLADVFALEAIAARITELGLTPNRLVALGANLILLVNLAWSAMLQLRFLRGKVEFSQLERWQTNYLPVYFLWALVVSVAFPVLFGFI